MKLKNRISLELKQLLKINETTKSWHIPMLTALSVGIPLLIGLYFNNLSAGLTACLGGMVTIYLPIKGSFTNRIVTLLISSFGFTLSFAIGQIFSFNSVVAVAAFGLFSLVIHWVILYYKTAPPRSFFFIFIAALSISQPYNFNSIADKVGLISLGLLFSCLLTLAYLIYLSTTLNIDEQPEPERIIRKNSSADYWESIIMGVFMALSLALGYILKMDNPYWIPVSCAAVMQGASTAHIWQRTFHRILGTLLGVCLSWFLLHFTDSIVILCIYIIILQLIVEILITRSYVLAVIFITPLAVFLSEAGNSVIDTPNMLITLRLKGIIIGSIIGAIGGWILHKEKIRYSAVRGLDKISG